MKKVLQNLVPRLVKGLKNLALSYLLVQVLTNRFPQVLTWLNGWTASCNSWFAGLAGWTSAVVTWCSGVGTVVGAWLPLLGHACLLMAAWWLLKRIVYLLFASDPAPRH